jgi:hypothetical protein
LIQRQGNLNSTETSVSLSDSESFLWRVYYVSSNKELYFHSHFSYPGCVSTLAGRWFNYSHMA